MKKSRTVLQAKRYGVYTCPPTCTLLEAARKMVTDDISALIVVNKDGSLAGVISRTDVLRAHLALEPWEKAPVRDYMSTQVVTVTPDDLLRDVAQHLIDRHIHRVVVVKPDPDTAQPRPVAVVSAADLVYHLVKDA
jgi:signal-transduction protein with cAMP-binding, CBS, and nucleotidyltransferase domain